MEAQERELRELPRGETRERLLAAASEEFALRGFANARVRHIVDQAGANLAAVNYHFGGKEGLYRATLARLTARKPLRRPHGNPRGLDSRQRLERRVQAVLERFVVHTNGTTLGRILAHEAMNPTAHLDEVIAESLKPELAELRTLLADVVPRAPVDAIGLAAIGVLGQCLLYQFARPALARAFPGLPEGRALCRTVAAHVTSFTIAGLRALEQAVEEAS